MIRRGKHRSNFTILPNAAVEDARLSAAARGTLAYLLSRPAGWSVRHDHLRRIMKLGRKGFARVMTELIEAGYVRRSEDQRRADDNTFLGYDYEVFDEPQPVDKEGSAVPFATAGSRQREGDSGNKNVPNKNLYKSNLPLPLTPRPGESQQGHVQRVANLATLTSASQRKPLKSPRVGTRDRGRLELEVANRFGPDGWSVLFALQPGKVDELCTLHKAGHLTDFELDRARASVALAGAKP